MQAAPTIAEEQELVVEEFALFDDVREKIEYIVDLGRHLPPLDDRHKVERNLVRGCQSRVWLIAETDDGAEQHLHLRADSDAIIVKGLIALVLRLYDDRPPSEIIANPPVAFERIGLGKMLTPGRSNGLYALIQRVRSLAMEHGGTAVADELVLAVT